MFWQPTSHPGGGGGAGVARIYREEALDTKVSSMAASSTFLGRLFQSLIVLGRKEELLYCVPAGMSWNCLLWPRCWREGRGISLDLRLGQWTRPMWIFYSMESLAMWQHLSSAGQSNASSMLLIPEVFQYLLRTKQAARRCTASTLLMFFWVWGSQMDEAYSSISQTKAL